jgi:hypothetical protein
MFDLRCHERDHRGRISLGVAGLVPGPQVDEDVLVRQDRAEFVGALRAEGRDQSGHAAHHGRASACPLG